MDLPISFIKFDSFTLNLNQNQSLLELSHWVPEKIQFSSVH